MADDAELSKQYRAAASGVAAGHLDDATWQQLASDGLSAPEKERAIEHVTRCTSCADVYRGLAQLRAEAVTFDPAAPRPARARLPLVRAGAALGLALAASVLALVWFRAPHPTGVEEPILRADPSRARPVPLAPIGKLDQVPAGFRFEPMTGAKLHHVQLLDGDGTAIWSSENLSGAAVQWPKAVKGAAGHYYWQVVGFPSGVASDGVASAMVDFEITSSPP